MERSQIELQFNYKEWLSLKQLNGKRKKLADDFHYMLNMKFQNYGSDINCFLKCRYEKTTVDTRYN